jgi:hypothetical protein
MFLVPTIIYALCFLPLVQALPAVGWLLLISVLPWAGSDGQILAVDGGFSAAGLLPAYP